MSGDAARFVRRSLEQLPASPPSPAPASLAGQLGVERVIELGLNEGTEGPFPAALAAMRDALAGVNRYPSRGSRDLVAALAARHGVAEESVFVAAGADAVIGYVCQATLDPGDEVVTAWPSFPSFVRDPLKRDAVPVTVPLVSGRIDLDAMAAAVTRRTRLLFVASPNNPTGLALAASDLTAFVGGLPGHVLPVIDEAYFDYLEPESRLDSIVDLLGAGREALVLRTFSKLYGLAGLRVGYGVGPPAVVETMRKVQRGYDVGALAQVAALASLADDAEVARRRHANRAAVELLATSLERAGFDVLAGSVANFVLVDVGVDADSAAAALLARGVVIQSGRPFGAPTSLRVTAGTPADNALLVDALATALRALS